MVCMNKYIVGKKYKALEVKEGADQRPFVSSQSMPAKESAEWKLLCSTADCCFTLEKKNKKIYDRTSV